VAGYLWRAAHQRSVRNRATEVHTRRNR
jgi:hypothetical protein